MIRNYLTLAIRNLLKRKVYSFINIFGVAIGISVCLVIWKYIEFELSYDNFHKNGDNIYRTLTTLYTDKKKIAAVGYDLGPSLTNNIPEIKTYVRISGTESVISYQSPKGVLIQFREANILWADSTFLSVFTFEAVFGDLSTALDKPSSIVLTQSMANKYFGKTIDPIGKILNLSGEGDFEVTAVVKTVPQNSHLSFDFLLSIRNNINNPFYKNNPRWNNFITYVQLNPHTTIDAVQEKMPTFVARYIVGETTSNHKPVITFQPVRKIHLSGGGCALDDGEDETGRVDSIYFFILISVFILAIAWVNYINLSTARAMERAREVGVKKAIGALRNQLMGQFIFESLLVNLLGVAVAVSLAIGLLPVLGDIVDKNISFDFSKPGLWCLLVILFLVGSLVSGAYPAFVLSSFKTIDVLKGTTPKTTGGFSLRQSLVVFQFTTSLLLIAGTFTIYRQIRFMQSQDKGLNMDRMLIVNVPHFLEGKDAEERLISFKNELLKFPSISHVASSGTVPGGGHGWETHAYRKGASKEEIIPGENINVVFVDEDFIETYDIPLQSGRVWNRDIASDKNAVLINEAALFPFGLGDVQQALDKKLIFEGDNTMTIIGVLKNFHWKSLKTEYLPTVLWPQKISFARFSVQLHGNIQETVTQVEQLYKIAFPGNLFEYYFLDDSFSNQYKAEQQFGEIFTLFALLAIVIACLGLWGLASFTTMQRLREISIRKVLGASLGNIMSLLSGQFLKLLLIATVIASPVTYYGVNSWLGNFAFKIDFSWDLYIVPVMILVVIALGTVSFQIFRGANSNPADVLRSQ